MHARIAIVALLSACSTLVSPAEEEIGTWDQLRRHIIGNGGVRAIVLEGYLWAVWMLPEKAPATGLWQVFAPEHPMLSKAAVAVAADLGFFVVPGTTKGLRFRLHGVYKPVQQPIYGSYAKGIISDVTKIEILPLDDRTKKLLEDQLKNAETAPEGCGTKGHKGMRVSADTP